MIRVRGGLQGTTRIKSTGSGPQQLVENEVSGNRTEITSNILFIIHHDEDDDDDDGDDDDSSRTLQHKQDVTV